MPVVIVDTPPPNGTSTGEDVHRGTAHRKSPDMGSCFPAQNLPTTYPSQALRFLHKVCAENSAVDTINDAQPPLHRAPLKLNVVVVGAGLGGLSLAIALTRRGHSVRVLEQASRLGEVSCRVAFL